jgi:hypothetical protein
MKNTFLQRFVIALGVVAAFAFSFVGCGGESPRLSPSFIAVHNAMTAMGMVQSGQISEGSLAQGGVARLTTHLRAGDCYTFVAFGTSGVSDIDVIVRDDTGDVATDRTEDSQAAAQFCPDAEGDYQIVVRMERGNGGYTVTTWSGAPRGGATASAGRSGGGRGSCGQPIALHPGTPVRGNTTQGQSSMTGSCIRDSEAPEIVYSLTLSRRSQVSVTINSDYDGALYILGACGEMRSEIGCNDDAPSVNRSQVDATLDAGTYFVVVDGYGNAAGEYELNVTLNDLQSVAQVCQRAAALTPGHAVTGSTANQPSYFTATCANGARSGDRVYSVNVPTRSRLRVRMQSTHDGAVYLRRECANPNTEIACNDNHRDAQHSMLVATVDPGRYYVYADGNDASNAGDYSLRADLAPLTGGTAPADACNSAGTATPGQDLELDTFQASDDLAGSCGGQGAPDVVYHLDVQNRVRLRARMVDSEFQAAMYIQRQCGQSASEVVCSSAAGGNGGTELDANLQPGSYFLVIDGLTPDQFGAARVEMQVDDLQALARTCQQAPRLRPGHTVTGDTSSSSDRFQASCASGARSADLVYQLVLTRRSHVRISSNQQYDGALYLRRDCIDASTEVACNDDSPDNTHSMIDTTLDRGTYYVFVDGFADRNQGSFTMDVDVSAAQGPPAPPTPRRATPAQPF